jgi:O-Antigen ligase
MPHRPKVSLSAALLDSLRASPLERAIQVAIVAFVLSAVLAGGAILSWIGVAQRSRWVFLMALLALSAVYAWRALDRAPDRALLAPAGLVALAVLSAAWSAEPGSSLAHALGWGCVIAVAVLLSYGSAGLPDAVESIAVGLVAAAAAVAVGGLLVLAFRYDRAVQPASTLSPARYQGLGGGPNLATMVLAVATPLAAYLALYKRTVIARILAAAVVAGLLASIALSGSRGAIAAAFAGLGTFAVLSADSARRRAVVVAAFAVTVAATLALASVPATSATNLPLPEGPELAYEPVQPSPGYIDANVSAVRLQDDVGHPGFGVADTVRRPRTALGSSGRLEAWRGALGQAAERPVAGYGFGTEEGVFVDRYVNFNSNVPENSFIGLLLQLGVVGLALFVLTAALLLWRGVRALPRLGSSERALAAACAGAFVAGIVLAFFQSYVYAPGNNATLAVWISGLLLLASTSAGAVRER